MGLNHKYVVHNKFEISLILVFESWSEGFCSNFYYLGFGMVEFILSGGEKILLNEFYIEDFISLRDFIRKV